MSPCSKPKRSPAYLRFVRSLPCAVSGQGNVEAAHQGPHGMSQKACDFRCIPLSPEMHRTGKNSHERLGRRFGEVHGLDIPAIAIRMMRAFSLSTGIDTSRCQECTAGRK